MACLEILADLASIFTAAVAGVAYLHYLWDMRAKRASLENHLRKEKQNARTDDRGQRSILHLMRYTKLTEAEIFHAARASRCIALRTRKEDATNLAIDLLFEYAPTRQSE
jgi:hypothetical protein